MSKIIASSAIRGAHQAVREAEDFLARAIAAKGAGCAVGFPDTAYSLPVIYSLLGWRVDTLADMRPVLDECRSLLPPVPSDKVWLPYLGDTLDAGMATLFAFEIAEACKYLIGPHPVNGLWLGAAGDVIIRERGIEFVDGSAPGFAAVVGAAPDPRTRCAHRTRTAGEESLRLHRRPYQRRVLRRATGRGGRGVGLGNPPGAVREGNFRGDLRARFRQPRGVELRRGSAGRPRPQPEVQQGPHLRLRHGAGRSDGGEVRRRRRSDLLWVSVHRRYGHPADPAHRHLHL